ncbi:MAG TPA: MFS transporter [Micromonosporaceae bacterium]
MRRSALLVVCLAVFVDMLGFGIILPMLPFHAERLGGSGAWVGALLTAYAAAQFLAAPVLGSLSDRYGRRRLLLLSLSGSMVSLALSGLAGSLVLLLLARVLAGAFGGAIAVGQAYVVDLTPEQDRTRALGMVGASIGLGFVFGPAIGAGLATAGIGFAGACGVAAVVAAVNLVLGFRLLPRTTPAGAPTDNASVRSWSTRLATLGSALHRRQLRPVLIALFAVTFAFTGMETTFALLGSDRYGIGAAGLGVVFTGVGVVMVIVQGVLVGRFTDRWGDARVAVGGAAAMALGLGLLPFVPVWLGYPALGLVAVGQGLLVTTTAALIAAVGGRALGGALGVGQSAAAAARAVGPIVAGVGYDLSHALPYLGGAALSLVAAALLSALVIPTGAPVGSGLGHGSDPSAG